MLLNNYKESIYNGDFEVDYSMVKDGKFIKNVIPKKINGNFTFKYHVSIETLEGGPTEVTGDYNCSDLALKNLEGAPLKIDKNFNCSFNLLASLKGAPKDVGGDFKCKHNQLTSLEGAPLKVNKDFNCGFNELTSLEGAPKKVGGFIYSSKNSNYLEVESVFIEKNCYKNNYWLDLLNFIIKEKIDPDDVKGWPVEFLNNNMINSIKNINKFKL